MSEKQKQAYETMVALAHRAWELPDNVQFHKVAAHVGSLLASCYIEGLPGLRQEEIVLNDYPIRVDTETWDCFMGYGPKSKCVAYRLEAPDGSPA